MTQPSFIMTRIRTSLTDDLIIIKADKLNLPKHDGVLIDYSMRLTNYKGVCGMSDKPINFDKNLVIHVYSSKNRPPKRQVLNNVNKQTSIFSSIKYDPNNPTLGSYNIKPSVTFVFDYENKSNVPIKHLQETYEFIIPDYYSLRPDLTMILHSNLNLIPCLWNIVMDYLGNDVVGIFAGDVGDIIRHNNDKKLDFDAANQRNYCHSTY